MATGTIIKVWRSNGTVYAAVSVDGIEYIGSTPLLDAQGVVKTNTVLKAELTAAVKAVRDAQLGIAPTAIAITGTVTV